MSELFTPFERWCLCCHVPWLELPELVAPTDLELQERAYLISYDLSPGEKNLASTLISLGALDYLASTPNTVTK